MNKERKRTKVREKRRDEREMSGVGGGDLYLKLSQNKVLEGY